MCGIYGQISLAPAHRECGESMRHRGPDDAGVKVLPVSGTPLFVSLIHRRLSIIDLSPAGHQPMCNERGDIWITFNGEIYNFQDLRTELVRAGHQFQSHTDTEVIIHGYEEWGPEVVGRLRGMFALAIWDAPKNKLTLVRDRLGKKPLFYYADQSKFLFGSEIKSILASGEVNPEPDPVALHDYLTYLYFPAPRTAFKGIRKLPPATLLELSVGPFGELKQQQRCYWDPIDQAESYVPASSAQLLAKTREVMNDSVRLRLISDVPLGVFLSGGLDSGAITALAARNSNQPIKTFTIGFETSRHFDEIESADEVAKAFGTSHRVIHADLHCAEFMSTVVRHFDEPFGNPTAILEYILTRHMREFVTVALSGDGGDEAFGGYVRYAGAALAHKYRKLPRFLTRDLGTWLAGLLRDDVHGRHGYRRVREFLESAWQPQVEMYLQWVGYFSSEEKSGMYTPEFRREVSAHDSGDFLRGLFRKAGNLDPFNQLGYVDMFSFLTGNCLEYADRMSMANSLEVRCPFADHKVLEFGLSLAPEWKYRKGETKRIMREAMKDILPAGILTKKKMGFNPPISQWLSGEVKPIVDQFLSPETVRRRGIFQPAAIQNLLREHAEQKRDHGLKIWALVMLELWFQMYIEQASGIMQECFAGLATLNRN